MTNYLILQMNSDKCFTLMLKEDDITRNLLFDLRKIFTKYPGKEKICLKILESHTGKFKYLELKNYKVNPCILFLIEIINKI